MTPTLPISTEEARKLLARPKRTSPLTISIPGKPKAWARARINKYGAHYTRDDIRKRESDIGLIANAEMRGDAPFDGAVRLTIGCFYEPPASWSQKKRAEALVGFRRPTGKPDADNLAKLVKDSLTGIAYVDDALVTELNIKKQYGPQAVTVVTVEELS